VSTLALYLVLLKAMAASFSGFGSLPQVRQDLVVTHHVISDDVLNRAVLVGRTTPGPIGVYVVSVGYEVAGWRGVAAGWLALITPSLLVIPIYRIAVRAATHRRARSAVGALVLASAVLIVIAGVPLASEVVERWLAMLRG
jgi:chromate transporter